MQENNITAYSGEGLHLIVHIHPAFRAYSVFNAEKKTFQLLSQEVETTQNEEIDIKNLQNWLNRNQAIFNVSFEKVYLLIDTDKFLVLPNIFNNESSKTDNALDTFNKTDIENDIIITNNVINYKFQWPLPLTLKKTLENHFNTKELLFGDYGFVKVCQKNKNKLVAQFYPPFLTIGYIDNDNTLGFYNKYKCKNENDFLYFLMAAYHHLNLDANEDALIICGFIEEDSILYEKLYGYIRNFEFVTYNRDYRYQKSFDLISEHYYANLFTIVE